MKFVGIEQLKGKSQQDKVLWFLENYGRISNQQSHTLLGVCHLPEIIRQLRKRFLKFDMKYEIVNERKDGCNRFGEPVWWDDYVLVRKKQDDNE